MKNWPKVNGVALERDIFLTGAYVHHFNPDDRGNPFSQIYRRKKLDTIDIINTSGQSKRILDVGGGMGRLSLDLSKSEQNSVILTDISVAMLRLAINHGGQLSKTKFVNADAYQLPFRDGSFDYVVGLDLLCHLENPERALREFHRVLTDQGVLILDSTNSNPLWALFYPRYLGKNPLNWFRVIRLRGVYPGWEHIVRHYSKKRFFSLLYEVGFRVDQSLTYGPRICPKWHLAVSRKII
jgi:glycogen(starch) synthase